MQAATRDYIFFSRTPLHFASVRGKFAQINRANAQRKQQMTQICRAAEYRYFSFTNYYFGKALSGLAENKGTR